MKQKITLSLFVMILSLTVLSGYRNGYASNGMTDGTGAEGSSGSGNLACGGTGCHGTTSVNSVTIELDSAGMAVTSYHPGVVYTVKITATNATGSTLPKFGFQLAAVKAVGSASASATQAGTWGSSLPTNVQFTSAASSGLPIDIIEQSRAITATSGTGANGTVYTESIPWTAPALGTGSVVLFGVINAVNGNNNQDLTDKSQQASPVTVAEAVSSHVGINDLSLSETLKVYPTVTTSAVTVKINASLGTLNYSIYGLDGRKFDTGTIAAGTNNTTIDMNHLSTGIYLISIADQSRTTTYKIVKQ